MPTVKETVEAMRNFIVAQNTVLNYLCEELAGKSIDQIFQIAMDKNQKKEDNKPLRTQNEKAYDERLKSYGGTPIDDHGHNI